MTKEELECFHIGEDLDQLMNLDPRGYGVCRILYQASRTYTTKSLTINAANVLVNELKEGDYVYIITGFILKPHKKPEMDGMVSSILLARNLILSFGAKPILICPSDCVRAVKECGPIVGIHVYENLEDLKDIPLSMGVVSFTKNSKEALNQSKELSTLAFPKVVIAIEAPGANACGEYHNAAGLNVSELEAKSDVLFTYLKSLGVTTIAIGDLGNEIGMGTIGEQIVKYIPSAGAGECKCDCKGGILAASKADHIITATVSDWGCYGMMAAIAYLKKDISLFHKGDMQEKLMMKASESGLIDMTGSLLPGIDGFHVKMNVTIVELMRQCVGYALKYKGKADHWFQSVLEKNFYQNEIQG